MTNLQVNAAGYLKWIPIRNLSVVWADAQRPYNEKRAQKIADTFDFDLFDPITVTLPNGNGIYHVIDGQTRKGAAQMLFDDEAEVPCRVVDAEDPARAAQIFRLINKGRKKPSAVEDFLVGVTAGERAECTINEIVTNLGYHVAGNKTPTSIPAVKALMNVYKAHGQEVLKETLMTIKCTWRDDSHALDGPVIEGYADLISRHRGHLDWQRLREHIAKAFTPGQLLGLAKNERELVGGTMPNAVRIMLIRTYNKGIKKGRLALERE